jgi:FdhD protein
MSFAFAAAVLAGGRSTRMGRDKAMLDWQGEPLWQHQLTILRQFQPQRLLVSARAEQRLVIPHDAEQILDAPGSDDGPLGAIAACLRATGMPVFVLATDMPRMSAEYLRGHLGTDLTQGLAFRIGDAFEPLAALYTPAMLPLLEEALASRQLALQPLIHRAVQHGLMRVIDVAPADEFYFRNVNTPADLLLDRTTAPTPIIRRRRQQPAESLTDVTAVEEPLEIRVEGRSVAVVMRTPGHDRELAAGFLVSEGVVQRPRDILEISQCPANTDSKGNIVDVLLGGAVVNWDSLTRHVFSASSCGLCGKTSIDSVFQRFQPVQSDWHITPELLWSLADKVRAAQDNFARTGGLHASALFDLQGNLLVLREDVGRHNALDKILGYGLLHGLLPFDRHILFLSGRVSFEMIQKALAGGIALVAAISAPSSLAVQFAHDAGQTLVGFLRDPSLNIYTHAHRVE